MKNYNCIYFGLFLIFITGCHENSTSSRMKERNLVLDTLGISIITDTLIVDEGQTKCRGYKLMLDSKEGAFRLNRLMCDGTLDQLEIFKNNVFSTDKFYLKDNLLAMLFVENCCYHIELLDLSGSEPHYLDTFIGTRLVAFVHAEKNLIVYLEESSEPLSEVNPARVHKFVVYSMGDRKIVRKFEIVTDLFMGWGTLSSKDKKNVAVFNEILKNI
jgi:hypothetical protein